MVSSGENRFEASFKASVLQTQGRRARARGCRGCRDSVWIPDTAEPDVLGEMLSPHGASLSCWGREKEAPKGRPMGTK